MIAIDTSSFIAYLEGHSGHDTDLVDQALGAKQIVLPPVVLTELLSDASIGRPVVELFRSIPVLEVLDGYWERAGLLRAAHLAKGHKARIADALIAQSCIDHRVGLLTRDADFKKFATKNGLVLIR